MPRRKRQSGAEKAVSRAAALIAAKQARQAAETPFTTFRPHPKQQIMIDSLAAYRAANGANRSGKSIVACWDLAACALCRHPVRKLKPGRYCLFVLTRQQVGDPWTKYLLGPDCRRSGDPIDGMLQPDDIARKANGDYDISWDYAPSGTIPRLIRLANGSEIMIMLHNQHNAWKALQGPNVMGCYFDEAGDETKRLLEEAMLRFVIPRSENPHAGFIVWVGTETTINEDYEVFLERGQDPDWEDYQSWTFTTADNPAVNQDVLDSIARDIGADAAAVRIHGTRSASDNIKLIEPHFDDDRHVLQGSYQPSHRANILVSLDPGVTDAAGIDLAYVDRLSPRRIVLFHSIRMKNATVSEWAEALLQALKGRKITWLTYDHYHGHRKPLGSGRRVIDLFVDHIRDSSCWQLGVPTLRRPRKGPIDESYHQLLEYMDPAPHVYHEPMLVIDKPTDENGLFKWLREFRRMRLKSADYVGLPLRNGVIHEKDNEAFDNARYMVQVAPIWQDLGINTVSERFLREAARPPEGEQPVIKTPEQIEQERALEVSAQMWTRRNRQIRAAKKRTRRSPWSPG